MNHRVLHLFRSYCCQHTAHILGRRSHLPRCESLLTSPVLWWRRRNLCHCWPESSTQVPGRGLIRSPGDFSRRYHQAKSQGDWCRPWIGFPDHRRELWCFSRKHLHCSSCTNLHGFRAGGLTGSSSACSALTVAHGLTRLCLSATSSSRSYTVLHTLVMSSA